MAGYGVSNVSICARMRELGIPDSWAKTHLGRTWSFYDQRRRNGVVFFLNHEDRVPIDLWERMTPKDREQFPINQQPDTGRLTNHNIS